MHQIYNHKFDSKAIVEHFGGVNNCHELLQSVGSDISLKAVQKWKERDNIPADAIASLLVVAARYTLEFKPDDFLLERAEDG